MDSLLDFLMFALPGGFIGSVFTWFVSRREHNNDMLSKLQASINMLSEENRKILAENVQLRRENAALQANQEEILQKQRALLREVEHLRSEITKLTNGNNETYNQMGNADHNDSGCIDGGRMRVDETRGEIPIEGGDIDNRVRITRYAEERTVDGRDDKDLGAEGATHDPACHCGGDCGGVREAGAADPEPP